LIQIDGHFTKDVVFPMLGSKEFVVVWHTGVLRVWYTRSRNTHLI
jgi:hypothetical protein